MKIAILGASRGLGSALVAQIHKESAESVLLLSSRKEAELKSLANRLDWVVPADFTNSAGQEAVINALAEFSPNMVFYVAGGGPFGLYQDKSWRDHAWALELNLTFPAKLIHYLLSHEPFRVGLQKVIVVGSAIAGHRPDPKASAYAAAKHGIRGLITSLQAENPWFDLQLYEPGYLDTAMLPPNAWPRQQGLATNPNEEARKLWQWSQSSVRLGHAP
jgi:short-subunit dehydrogenase